MEFWVFIFGDVPARKITTSALGTEILLLFLTLKRHREVKMNEHRELFPCRLCTVSWKKLLSVPSNTVDVDTTTLTSPQQEESSAALHAGGVHLMTHCSPLGQMRDDFQESSCIWVFILSVFCFLFLSYSLWVCFRNVCSHMTIKNNFIHTCCVLLWVT